MKNIAIVGGGFSSEAEIAVKSAGQLVGMMDSSKYNLYVVSLLSDKWTVEVDGEVVNIDKADFSFTTKGRKVVFDCVYITAHGRPGENGVLQSYFDLLGLPYTSCGAFESALTFNKFACKSFLDKFGVTSAKAVLLRKGDAIDANQIVATCGLPCFVKPNNDGSSFGVSKCTKIDEVVPAVEKALALGNEVIIEEFIKGTEVTNGVYGIGDKVTVLPITEIVSENDFFDYEAKYTGKSKEITPARLSPELEAKCKALTAKIYRYLNCTGIVRIDYIIRDGECYMLEINTVPGMSAASIIPQQLRAAQMDAKQVFSEIIEDAICRMKR